VAIAQSLRCCQRIGLVLVLLVMIISSAQQQIVVGLLVPDGVGADSSFVV
jgi:hypothetical protein